MVACKNFKKSFPGFQQMWHYLSIQWSRPSLKRKVVCLFGNSAAEFQHVCVNYVLLFQIRFGKSQSSVQLNCDKRSDLRPILDWSPSVIVHYYHRYFLNFNMPKKTSLVKIISHNQRYKYCLWRWKIKCFVRPHKNFPILNPGIQPRYRWSYAAYDMRLARLYAA